MPSSELSCDSGIEQSNGTVNKRKVIILDDEQYNMIIEMKRKKMELKREEIDIKRDELELKRDENKLKREEMQLKREELFIKKEILKAQQESNMIKLQSTYSVPISAENLNRESILISIPDPGTLIYD